jgi:hypothetical protein
MLIVTPTDWFGPAWDVIGRTALRWVGAACLSLGVIQFCGLWRSWSLWILSMLLFFSAMVFWTGGIFIAAVGISAHQGMIVALFMIYIGAHKLAISSDLMTRYRQGDY